MQYNVHKTFKLPIIREINEWTVLIDFVSSIDFLRPVLI